MRGLFMRYLYVKILESYTHDSKDIAQVKVISLRSDTDKGVMTIALRTVVPVS
jgi:hypothetical protein